jgi:hypothetical protein
MRVARKSERSSARRARLAAYMATGVGAIGLGTSSQAAVVSIDLTGKTGDNMGIAPGPGSYPTGRGVINNFGTGSRLNAFNNVYGKYTGIAVQSMGAGGTPVGTLTTSGNGAFDTPINVGAGVAIGPSSGFFAEGYISALFKNHLRSAPDFGPNSFLGFRTAAGQYGYIEVLWTASTSTFKLVSAAYESTPGVAIQTPGGGGGGAVPEPASGAVVALLMGGTALRQWRKKRRDQETACDESLAS